jgi:uncharacterized protein
MKIIVSEIPAEGLDIELRETIKSDASSFPARAKMKIKKVGAEVVISGTIEADLELLCSRCLKDFRSMLTIPVNVVYNPVEILKGEDKHELKVDELDMGFYSGDELDLLDLVKEQIILNLSMKPLCSGSCKGICLKCGTDLNADTCSCTDKGIDSRLEGLKKLLK